MTHGLDFFVLTGFLGSGKTTLHRDYLTLPEASDTAIIVNEVGEIGLDSAILRETSGSDVSMAMLSNGCVCCAIGSDLAFTVEALLRAERPGAVPLRRIILETSGLSRPGPILRQLSPLAPHRLRVRVIATYDAERGAKASPFAEATAQWAGADTIVLTKLDRVSPSQAERAEAEATRINPLAQLVNEPERRVAVAGVFANRSAAVPFKQLAGGVGPGFAAAGISVLLARTSRVVDYADLAAWLDNLAGLAGERLLRLKGLVRITECARPMLVQSVGTTFSPPRPFAQADQDSFVVVIGQDLTPREVMSIAPDLSLRVSDRPKRRLIAQSI